MKTFTTTVSVTVRADLQDSSDKALPGARMNFAEHWDQHLFRSDGECHTFRVTASTPHGSHQLTLEFIDDSEGQGALEVLSVSVQGNPIGLDLFRCEYRPYNTSEIMKSHLYMGWPGKWTLPLDVPVHEKMGGIGFV
jgi:hypothetical protein